MSGASASRAVLVVGLVLLQSAANGVEIRVHYDDAPGVGFYDPVRGASRRTALEYAAALWGAALAGAVPVEVSASMLPLGGTGTGAVLASTGPSTLHRNFDAGEPDTWYAAALANQLAGRDLNGTEPEIETTFNGDIDDSVVLGSTGWYYGTDADAGSDVDFVTIALHEFGHGLGFINGVGANGDFLVAGSPAILDRFLDFPGIGDVTGLRTAERRAAIVSGTLVWSGASATAFNGSAPAIYAPDPFQIGSSLGHWQAPNELLAPSYLAPTHDFGLLLPALFDLGWPLQAATPTPRALRATPTATLSPPATPAVGPLPIATDLRAFVSNYDDGTVSVLSTEPPGLISTISVGRGPLGLTASRDGARVYVANFQDGTLSVIDALRARVIAAVEIGESATDVAVTPDGALLAVTDTSGEHVVIVSAADLRVVGRVAVGETPSAIALDPSGAIALVPSFTGRRITVVDVASAQRRGLIPFAHDGLVGISVPQDSPLAAVSAFHSPTLQRLDVTQLYELPTVVFLPGYLKSEGLAVTHDGARVYIAAHNIFDASGRVIVVADRMVERFINVGLVPLSVALTPDERWLFVANAGSDTVSVVDLSAGGATDTVAVGRGPSRVVFSDVPRVCAGDCSANGLVSVDELVLATQLLLDDQSSDACSAVDADHDGRIRIDEIVRAVSFALDGCPAAGG